MARPWKIPTLRPEEPLDRCLKKVLRTRCRETFSYAEGALLGENIEALHDMRVASRRLQAVLRVFRICFPRKRFSLHYRPLRELISSLGRVRELDVFIDSLDSFSKSLTPQDRRAIDLLVARYGSERNRQRGQLKSLLAMLMKEDFQGKFLKFVDGSL